MEKGNYLPRLECEVIIISGSVKLVLSKKGFIKKFLPYL